ncbi:uncharacterized protein ChaoS9_090 [Halobacterium phage ChaoS9]|uniref:Tail assembly chaperone n=1 Tax=Halobacterium phage ChaoS9 TaxID=2847105 RepID=A0A481V9F0_9CAUD|nr:uncharacterized protein KMC41_gp19 [Halobacterium phage ChaoS9]QBI90025.1 uncharacterized protein ChaoS9_090 [Halobacterium phage ChaoS9]
MTEETDSNPESEEAVPDEADLSEVDASEIDIEELENQEWTLGGEQEEVITFAGMQFLVEEPDDEDLLNMIAGAAGGGDGNGDGLDGSDRMYKLVESAVKAPEVTPEKWREMRSGERIGLAMKIAEFAGIHQMVDFPDAGQTPQPDA